MSRELPTVGVTSYNGFTFPEAISARVLSNYEYDDANRAVKYVNYVITIEAIIISDDAPVGVANTDAGGNAEDIRKRLSEPGKALSFTQQGFGTLEINIGAVKDIAFGPKPRILAWEPIGSNRAFRILWTVETRIPDCYMGSPVYSNKLAQFTFGVTWDIDEAGMTSRTIAGVLEIPVQFQGASISDTADNYRERLEKIPAVSGFHRTQNYTLSEDKRTMHFVVADKEIPSPNAYPAGIVRVSLTQTVNGGLATGGWNMWTVEYAGSVEVAAGYNKSFGWMAILRVLKKRRDAFRGKKYKTKGTKYGKSHDASLITQSIMIEEDIFSRSFSFSVVDLVFVGLDKLISATGLFSAVEGSWGSWSTSLSEIQDSRGFANMKHQISDDIIVNLCGNAERPINNSSESENPAKSGNPLKTTETPDAKSSWIIYIPNFEIITDDSIVVHRKLSTTPPSSPSSSTANDGSETGFSFGSDIANPSPGDVTVQTNGAPIYYLRFWGNAARVGHKIPVPFVTKIGGSEVKTAAKWSSHKTLGGNPPMYSLSWDQRYIIPEGIQKNKDLLDTVVTTGHPENKL